VENQNQQTQTPQVPNQMPSPVNNPSGSKVIPIILGVAAVAIIAISAYVLGTKQNQVPVQNIVQITPIPSPTADPTASWKMYNNQQYGIAFMYPREWNVAQRDVEKMENLGELGKPYILELRAKPNEQYPPIALLIYNNVKNLSLEKFQEELRSGPLTGDSIPIWTKFDSQIVNSDGITVYYGNEKYCGSYQCRRYSWKGKNKIFTLILFNNYIPTYHQIFDQILSTFRFSN